MVDDHSGGRDVRRGRGAGARATRACAALRFARNFGSHTALICGLHQARGECVAALAADLQDPPR